MLHCFSALKVIFAKVLFYLPFLISGTAHLLHRDKLFACVCVYVCVWCSLVGVDRCGASSGEELGRDEASGT